MKYQVHNIGQLRNNIIFNEGSSKSEDPLTYKKIWSENNGSNKNSILDLFEYSRKEWSLGGINGCILGVFTLW